MSDHSDTESFKSAHEETSTYIQTGKSNPDPSRQNLDSKLERLPADQETVSPSSLGPKFHSSGKKGRATDESLQ